MYTVDCPDQHISWEYCTINEDGEIIEDAEDLFWSARIAAEDLTKRYPVSAVYLMKDGELSYRWFNGEIT